MKRAIVLVMVLVVAGFATAAQQSRWTPSKALSSDFSGDGNATFNMSYQSPFKVNNSGFAFGNWSSYLQGNLTNASLSQNRTWTLPDLSGTIATLENSNTWGGTQTFTNGPAFSDYSSAQHDHLDADDAGALSAAAIASGTMARARLPGEVAYEDEANVFTPPQTVEGTLSTLAFAYIGQALKTNGTLTAEDFLFAAKVAQINGTFVAKTNSYFEGPIRLNASAQAASGLTVTEAGQTVTIGAEGPSGQAGICAEAACLYSAGGNFWGMDGDSLQISGGGFLRNTAPLDTSDAYQMFVSGDCCFPRFLIRGDGDLEWGTGSLAGDVKLYREASNTLATDDKLHVVGEVEMDAALDHDGSTVGFFGVAPIARYGLTDGTGGTVGSCSSITAAAVYTQGDMLNVKNCLASILDLLGDYGLRQ